ncbi:MAG: hypothetical protein M3441_19050 [Chloroflexota bacterium]|nr:hypothetical protein [Chloroflexota bacterium]
MIDDISAQYEYFYNLPFPEMAGMVGDFLLYDGLLAGIVDSYIHGVPVVLDDIPTPDEGTIEAVSALRQKPFRTQEEQSFLQYFDALGALRASLEEALQPKHPTSRNGEGALNL